MALLELLTDHALYLRSPLGWRAASLKPGWIMYRHALGPWDSIHSETGEVCDLQHPCAWNADGTQLTCDRCGLDCT